MADDTIKNGIGEHARLTQAVLSDAALVGAAERIADAICASFAKGGKVITLGNGGSAADAQHMAAELLGKYLVERKALPAIALTANSSALTAIANDTGFENVFSRQLEALAGKNDVVVCISTSGNSPNVVKAAETARQIGAFTVAFVGGGKCALAGIADVAVAIPSTNTPRVQEMHMMLIHLICEMVEASTNSEKFVRLGMSEANSKLKIAGKK